MTTDTPRRSIHQVQSHSGWARRALSFTSGDTSRRNRTSSVAIAKTALCIILLLLVLAGFSAFSGGRQSSRFGSQRRGSALEQLGRSAIHELRDCTAASKSPLCKWVRRHNRANRKRPVDWEPAEGWPENAEVLSSIRHTSDRTLTAVEKADKPLEPLQNIVQSFWPMQPAPGVDTRRSSLPQCASLHNRPCIAIIGNGNVSHHLQPELQNCITVQELELVTAANCQHSADVWIASQPSALSTLAALTSDNQPCSTQQTLSSTKALWYLGGELTHIQQLKSQDTSMAGVPAVHFPAAVWKERYNSRPLAAQSAEALQPSALWIGLITILECSSPDMQIHVFTPQPSSQAISLHDVAAETDLLDKMHASGMVLLHQDCAEGVPCIASPRGVSLQGHEGLVAPGVKLYPHRKKWQDSSMRVYNDDEEDEDDGS